MPETTSAEVLAGVLAEHWSYEPTKNFDAWLCECGARIMGSNEGDLDAAMQAHVAAALDAALTQGQDETFREAWPCDDYKAPITCLTTPKPKTLLCAWCASQPNRDEVQALYRRTQGHDAGRTG